MTELRRLAASSDEPPTNAGKFLAKRGHVVMKQFHEIGTLKCDLGTKLTFTTLVFAIAQGTKGDRTFGLKIEHATREVTTHVAVMLLSSIQKPRLVSSSPPRTGNPHVFHS